MELDLDRWIELLGDKVVQTKSGPYISVKHLRDLEEEFKQLKENDKPTGDAKTMVGARKAALKDADLLAAFGPKLPKAPADAGVVKPVTQEKTDEAA